MRTFLPLLSISFLFATTGYAQWTPLNANIQSIVSMTEQGGDLFAASYPNGVFTSTDGGTTWTGTSTGLPMSGTNVFVRSVGSNATNLFAGTHDGIYTSANSGGSWAAANGTLTASNQIYADKFFNFGVKTFAVFTGTIGMGGGIYSTTTNGSSWAVGHVGMGSNARVRQLVEVGANLYAATSAGLYASTDNGANWAQVPTANYEIYAIGVVGSNIAAITAFGYKYINLGTLVIGDATGAPANPTAGEMIGFDGMVYANTSSGTGALRSTDGGQTYTAFNTGLSPIDQSSLNEFLSTSTTLFVGALFDVYSVDGMTISVQENTSNAVAVWPTYFDDGFQVDLTSISSSANPTISILDAQGRAVFTKTLPASGVTTVNASQLASGCYTYRIIAGDGNLLGNGKLVAY